MMFDSIFAAHDLFFIADSSQSLLCVTFIQGPHFASIARYEFIMFWYPVSISNEVFYYRWLCYKVVKVLDKKLFRNCAPTVPQ